MSSFFDSRLSESRSLFERALQVVPGGIYGHTSPAAGLPGIFPYFAESAEGCRFTDVDGNQYLDFMCGFGPIVLGHQHPEVEEAAARAKAKGNLFNVPSRGFVELAELMVQRVDFADWAVFAKNGSDVTTWALQVAREATGRKKILMLKGAYHGIDAWCAPGYGGIIEEDREHIHRFEWNKLDSLVGMLDSLRDQVAGVFVTPYHHPSFAASEMPENGFLTKVQAECNRRGIVIILDDIRTGFRLHAGGSHRRFGFEPDIACYCKAMGNGFPISSAVGRDSLKTAAAKVFLTGSYWNNADAMAAAATCLTIIERDKVPERIEAIGDRLCRGLTEAAAKHGYVLQCSGPRAAPYPFFEGDQNLRLAQSFCGKAVRKGAFFHPHHNWFLSAAHDEKSIDEAVAIATECLREMSEAGEKA
ncbi:aminotransferase class III-fold pyridoxal phosphate-dependent enzyme [Puniceicoccus vermicola]|uniref:Aminotransferase class III-fold pyridoxal phosphate-dependent enzyme n=1 Tax=Puniceicoccus vermicola TaxID=388746 RepID=A0A7X1B218_9BACT|nr:aminotransferase class III-fold pyridoxal phosphate-dependent enzyme [Puniceicoccus vermicola]